uniref:Uncharacterized protein n=1 Tax=Candidatus Nitrotoga fabula TaxID=2182327 RepID=A0A2X0QZ87_9PROT|nr:protein of unknown function [Candidatus Nitrotoga fabula]
MQYVSRGKELRREEIIIKLLGHQLIEYLGYGTAEITGCYG